MTDAGLARLLSVLSADCLVSVIGTSVCRLSAAREKKIRTGSGFIFPLDEGEIWIFFKFLTITGFVLMASALI